MKFFKNLNFVILFCLASSFLYSQNISVDSILSNSKNFYQLPEDVQQDIIDSSARVVKQFENQLKQDFSNLTFTIQGNCKTVLNQELKNQYISAGVTPEIVSLIAISSECEDVKKNGFLIENIKQKFDKEFISSDKTLSMWVNNKNIKFFEFIEMETNPKKFRISANEDYLEGVYKLPNLTLFDIYRMNKYYNVSKERSTKYIGPTVTFNSRLFINDVAAKEGSSIIMNVPLWKINQGQFSILSKEYANKIQKIVEEVSYDTLKKIKSDQLKAKKRDEEIQEFFELYKELPLSIVGRFIIEPNENNTNDVKLYISNIGPIYSLFFHEQYFEDRNKIFKKYSSMDPDLFFTKKRFVEISQKKLSDIKNKNILKVGNVKFKDFINKLIDFDTDSVKFFFGEKFDVNNDDFLNFQSWLYFYFSSLSNSDLNKNIKSYKDNYLQIKMFSGYNLLLNDYLEIYEDIPENYSIFMYNKMDETIKSLASDF